jgi:hypothetical protein
VAGVAVRRPADSKVGESRPTVEERAHLQRECHKLQGHVSTTAGIANRYGEQWRSKEADSNGLVEHRRVSEASTEVLVVVGVSRGQQTHIER